MGLAGSAVQLDLAGGSAAAALADSGTDVGWRLGRDGGVVPPGRSVAGAGTAVLAGAVLAGAVRAGTGLGGARSALLVNDGHGPLSGSADRTGLAALAVLSGADGLLAMTVGAEAGTAGGAVGETGPSGRRNPDGLSDRGWSAEACGSAAPPVLPPPGS